MGATYLGGARVVPRPMRHVLTAALVVLAAAGVLVSATAPIPAFAREHSRATTRTEVAIADLPREARVTLGRIHAGGPFPYERDGITFGNRERRLPREARGYYHEYTVRTPGVHNRGARRIICGGAKTAPDACYYTDDHYQTFRKIRE